MPALSSYHFQPPRTQASAFDCADASSHRLTAKPAKPRSSGPTRTSLLHPCINGINPTVTHLCPSPQVSNERSRKQILTDSNPLNTRPPSQTPHVCKPKIVCGQIKQKVDEVERKVEDVERRNRDLQCENAQLRREKAQLQHQVEVLQGENAQLRRRGRDMARADERIKGPATVSSGRAATMPLPAHRTGAASITFDVRDPQHRQASRHASVPLPAAAATVRFRNFTPSTSPVDAKPPSLPLPPPPPPAASASPLPTSRQTLLGELVAAASASLQNDNRRVARLPSVSSLVVSKDPRRSTPAVRPNELDAAPANGEGASQRQPLRILPVPYRCESVRVGPPQELPRLGEQVVDASLPGMPVLRVIAGSTVASSPDGIKDPHCAYSALPAIEEPSLSTEQTSGLPSPPAFAASIASVESSPLSSPTTPTPTPTPPSTPSPSPSPQRAHRSRTPLFRRTPTSSASSSPRIPPASPTPSSTHSSPPRDSRRTARARVGAVPARKRRRSAALLEGTPSPVSVKRTGRDGGEMLEVSPRESGQGPGPGPGRSVIKKKVKAPPLYTKSCTRPTTSGSGRAATLQWKTHPREQRPAARDAKVKMKWSYKITRGWGKRENLDDLYSQMEADGDAVRSGEESTREETSTSEEEEESECGDGRRRNESEDEEEGPNLEKREREYAGAPPQLRLACVPPKAGATAALPAPAPQHAPVTVTNAGHSGGRMPWRPWE